MVVGRSSIMAAGPMQVAFLVQIAYAIFTWMLAGLVIEYQGYDLIASGIKLKGGLIDYYIFFLVFLFGVRNAEDGLKVIKWMLVGAIFANLCTHSRHRRHRQSRLQGAHRRTHPGRAWANPTSTPRTSSSSFPGMIAAAVGSRGLMRLAWLAGALLSCFALATTASRGGIVGALLACVVGAYLFRHLVSYSRVAGWVLGSLVVFVIVLSFSQYGGLLSERIFGQTGDIDVTEATSGRSETWLNLFLTMMRVPITFITGFGWNVYWSFPFRFSPHNHYFSLWFNLGLVGLLTGSYLLFGAIGRARRASLVADPAIATAAHRLRHRRHRGLWRRVLRRTARSLDLLLDVHRHRHAAGLVHRAAHRARRPCHSGVCRRAFRATPMAGRRRQDASRHDPQDLHRRTGLLWPAVG